jgi:hypothetical protein
MKFGDSINIFGTEYQIKLKKKVMFEGKEVSGTADFANHIISISTNVNKKHRLKTLFHEIIHCIIHEVSIDQVIGSDIEEVICDTISKGVVKAWEHLSKIN